MKQKARAEQIICQARAFFVFLELPRSAELDAAATLFAGPAGEAEVESQGRFAGFNLPAEFEHAAAAFDTGAWDIATTGEVGSGLAAKFILVGKTAVETVLVVDLVREACANAEAVTVYGGETAAFVSSVFNMYGGRVTCLMAVEIFQIAVKGVAGYPCW